jgi:undecaprenyl-diphosphatase
VTRLPATRVYYGLELVLSLPSYVVVAVLLVRRRCVNDALVLCVAFVGVEVVNAALKLIFHRPRPELAFVHLETYSFPSGHAAASTAVYGTLAYLLCRRTPSPWLRGVIAVATVVTVGLVAFSRLYLGVHYLSDVLAGWGLSAAIFALCGMIAVIVAFMRQNEAARA